MPSPQKSEEEEKQAYLRKSKEWARARAECKEIMPTATENTLDSCAQTIYLERILDKGFKNIKIN